MPLYMKQFSYKPEAITNMINNPAVRSIQAQKHLEQTRTD